MRGFLQLKSQFMKKKIKKRKPKRKIKIKIKNRIDRLSDLPLDLRGLILPLLPVKDAVRTAALSSAWRRPSPSSFLRRRDSFTLHPSTITDVDFLQSNVLLRRLVIPSPFYHDYLLRPLLLDVGLQELVLHNPSRSLPLPAIPGLVLESRSLRFLSVRSYSMRYYSASSLTNLRTLKLERVAIPETLLSAIVEGSRFLERLELVFCELLTECKIHAQGLKHLVLRPSRGVVGIDIDTPSLQMLTLYTRPKVQKLVIVAPKVRKAFLHLADPVCDWGIGVEQFLAGAPELVCLTLRGSSAGVR